MSDKIKAVNAGYRERTALINYWRTGALDPIPCWKVLETALYDPATDTFTLPDGRFITVEQINNPPEQDTIYCAGKGCLEPVKEEGERCPSCEAARAEYEADRAQELAYEIAKDDYYQRKLDERRGK